MTSAEWDRIEYFRPEEFDSPELMSFDLLKKLDQTREFYGQPMIITSSYREGDPLAHGKGYAVDVRVRGSLNRKNLVLAGHQAGFERIGIETLHVHFDVDPDLPKGWFTGISK